MTTAAVALLIATIGWFIGAVDVTTLAAAVLGGGAVTAGANAFLVKSSKKDIITKAAEQAVAAADTMIENLREENADLRKRVKLLEDQVSDLRAQLAH